MTRVWFVLALAGLLLSTAPGVPAIASSGGCGKKIDGPARSST